MKLIKLTLPCPAVYTEIVEKIQSLAATSKGRAGYPQTKTATVIGGGCLSDLYQDRKVLDIDVFTTVHIDDRQALSRLFGDVPIREKRDADPTHYDSRYYTQVLSFSYKGYEIDIIEVVSIHRIWDFDFRFRQFYFLDGAAYASEDALADIQAKRLVIVNPHSCLSTFCRAFYFQSRYGFTIDKKSFQLLMHFMNYKGFPMDYVTSYIRRYAKLTQQQKQHLLDKLSNKELYQKVQPAPQAVGNFTTSFEEIFWEMESPNQPFDRHCFLHFSNVQPVLPEAYQVLLFDHLHRDHANMRSDVGLMGKRWNQIVTYQPKKLPEPFTFTLSVSEHLPYFQELLNNFRLMYTKNRLRLLTQGKQELASFFQQLLDQPFTEQTMQEMITHRKKFITFFNIKGMHQNSFSNLFYQTSARFHSLGLLQDQHYTVSFHADTDFTRIGDITDHLVFIVRLTERDQEKEAVTYSFLCRQCTNGKYTITSTVDSTGTRVDSTGTSYSTPFAVIQHVMKLLAHRYPKLFTVPTPRTQLLISRQSQAVLSEFFVQSNAKSFFSNDHISITDAEENTYTGDIRNILFADAAETVL